MVIRASSSRAVDALTRDLASTSALKRDAAVARLVIIGARAVQRLLAVATDREASASARAAAFRALEAIADSRALGAAVAATVDPDPGIAAAAIGVAGIFLHGPDGMQVLDRVTAIALDRQRDRAVRLAAIRALLSLELVTVKPILAALASDADAEVARAVRQPGRRRAVDPTQHLADAARGSLGDDPSALRRALLSAAHELTPSALHQIVERVRIREGAEPPDRRAEWVAVRGAAHGALAQRGNRLALYDLRETVASAKQPLPVEFLSALSTLGEANCLESVAGAYARAIAEPRPDDWWRRQLADAFRAIVGRERVTRRNAVVKRMEKKWPGLYDALVRPEPKPSA